MFQMLGVFAEFEHSIIQERVRAGLQRARREGKRLGRPPIADKLAERIRTALAGGMSVRKTAAKFDVNPSTVQRIARPFGDAEGASAAAWANKRHPSGSAGVLVPLLPFTGAEYVPFHDAVLGAFGGGKLGTTSASPSITFAVSSARAASMVWMTSMACSISSSVIALMALVECSSFSSLGTSIAQTFKYAAGDSRRTRLNTSRPCCCQSSARSSRKRLLNARRVASGLPPGFPDTPARYWPLALRSLRLALRSPRRARGIASWFSGVGLIGHAPGVSVAWF